MQESDLLQESPLINNTLSEYFNHIGFIKIPTATLNTLRQLHQLHPQKITFEGLNPLLGLPVNLEIEALTEKLLRSGRGGYCFEQNTLFRHVLKLIGFEVKSLTAKSLWNKPEGAKAQRTHMLLLVKIEEDQFIADVGFGGLTLTSPLKFIPDIEQETPHELFRIIRSGEEFIIQAKIKDQWKSVYSFDLQEQHPHDFEVPNWYVSTHPESKFTTTLIAARPVPGKRYSLKNNEFSVHQTHGSSEKKIIGNAEELKRILNEVFEITIQNLEGLDEKLKEIIDSKYS